MARRSLIERRVRYWQKKLRLSEWQIKVEIGPVECGADAEAAPHYQNAVLRFDPTQVPEKEIDAWAVHELVHCVMWRLERQAEAWAGDDEAKYEVVRDIAETIATDLERIILNVAGIK